MLKWVEKCVHKLVKCAKKLESVSKNLKNVSRNLKSVSKNYKNVSKFRFFFIKVGNPTKKAQNKTISMKKQVYFTEFQLKISVSHLTCVNFTGIKLKNSKNIEQVISLDGGVNFTWWRS